MVLEVPAQEFESASKIEVNAAHDYGARLTPELNETRVALEAISRTLQQWEVTPNNCREPQHKSEPRDNNSVTHDPDDLERSILASVLRSFPDPITVCSANGTIYYLNPPALALFGYNGGEIFGHKFASLLMPVPPDKLALSPEYWDRAARGQCLKARRKSGEIFPVELSRSDLKFNGKTLFLVSVRDTSAQQRVKQHVEELQGELLHLARFTAMGELASMVTHELQQPLAAIVTYAAAARQVGAAAQASSEQASLDLLDKIAGQARRCGDIIRKLRQLVSDRSIDRVYADLCATVQEAVQLASFGAAKHNIQISVELPPQPVIILMDRSQILMLISNLLRNAVDELAIWRHERKIEVTLTLPSPDMAQLVVADTGPGILSTVFENIFDPFHTTKPEGSGMGLALSRRIAEAHSGRLAAANRPDGGAMFMFCIPIGKSEKVGE